MQYEREMRLCDTVSSWDEALATGSYWQQQWSGLRRLVRGPTRAPAVDYARTNES